MHNSWLDTTEYPFTSRFFEAQGQKLHYIDEGQGEIILFIHGTPSWSFEYRKVIKNLQTNYRCVAIDHIGFGLSDKPKDYDYSVVNHSMMLENFIFALNIDSFHLVVHDFGGPIGLNFAINYPDKVKSLILLNTWLWSSIGDPDYEKTAKFLKSPLLPFLYKCLNISPKVLLPKSFGEVKIGREILQHYIKPFSRRSQREGPYSFAKSLLNEQEWFESLWEKRDRIVSKATLLIWGLRDSFIKEKNLDKFLCYFRNSSVIRLEGAGHFPQEEQPEVVSQSISKFLTRQNTDLNE